MKVILADGSEDTIYTARFNPEIHQAAGEGASPNNALTPKNFIDNETGKAYKTAAALKAAITRKNNVQII